MGSVLRCQFWVLSKPCTDLRAPNNKDRNMTFSFQRCDCSNDVVPAPGDAGSCVEPDTSCVALSEYVRPCHETLRFAYARCERSSRYEKSGSPRRARIFAVQGKWARRIRVKVSPGIVAYRIA